MKYTILFPLLLLIGTFTINSSFGQYGNLDWKQICTTVEFALYNSCDINVNSFGQLTVEGERAMGCILNGLGLGGGAALLGTPLEIIIPGLNILAGMTGCDGIVKLDLLSTIENPNQLLNTLTQMLSGNSFTNTVPQNELDKDSLSHDDWSINTNSQDEFLLFSNELFSLYYPSDWKYEENNYLDYSGIIFYPKNNLGPEVIAILTSNTNMKNLDELHLNNPLLANSISNDIDIQDINKENIYLGKYPALKLMGTINDKFYQKITGFMTVAKGKMYGIMLMSNDNSSREQSSYASLEEQLKLAQEKLQVAGQEGTYSKDSIETNSIFERMVSSFDIQNTSENLHITGQEGDNSNNIDTLYNKGVALDSLGNYNEAREYFKKVLEIDPNHADALKSKNDAVFDAMKEFSIDSN